MNSSARLPRQVRQAVHKARHIDSLQDTLNVMIHIPFSHQFLRSLPTDKIRFRVMVDTLNSIKHRIQSFPLDVRVIPVLPFHLTQDQEQTKKKKKQTEDGLTTGLKISGPRQQVLYIEQSLTHEDWAKFIQTSKQHYKKQQLLQIEKQKQFATMAHKAMETSLPSSLTQGLFTPFLPPTQIPPQISNVWTGSESPPLPFKQQKQKQKPQR
jgi:hypothetical protein